MVSEMTARAESCRSLYCISFMAILHEFRTGQGSAILMAQGALVRVLLLLQVQVCDEG